MGFIREAFRGKLSLRRHRQQHDDEPSEDARPAHALDTLPTLPPSRRPITPQPCNPQRNSPFFRLPPEIRQHIYRLLLAGSEIHIDMRYTATSTAVPHSTRGAAWRDARRWVWAASHCHRHPGAQAMSDGCCWGGAGPTACGEFAGVTPCGIGREVGGLLRCCRLAYREAAPVLYRENTFHLTTGALLLYTDRLLPAGRAGAVGSLVMQVFEETAWDYAAAHLGIEPGLPAYDLLLRRIPDAFPSLTRLLVVVHGWLREPPWAYMRQGRVTPSERDDDFRDCLLSAMDGAVAGFERPLAECVMAMAHPAFDRLMEEQRAAAARVETREGKWLQFWRPVGAAACRDDAHERGYWIRRVAPEEQKWKGS